jgi:hypothetical protein
LKQRIFYNQLPYAFDSLQLPAPVSLDSITDSTIRHRLLQRCERIIQQTKSDMMAIYIAVTEADMRECQNKFDRDMDRMKRVQDDPVSSQKLTSSMVILLRRRLSNITEHIKYLYDLKVHFFVLAPTVVNTTSI